jgi:hypothetical protein
MAHNYEDGTTPEVNVCIATFEVALRQLNLEALKLDGTTVRSFGKKPMERALAEERALRSIFNDDGMLRIPIGALHGITCALIVCWKSSCGSRFADRRIDLKDMTTSGKSEDEGECVIIFHFVIVQHKMR